MAALTANHPQLEGSLGNATQSSAVQAAIAFYPPTNFLDMDRWALKPCAAKDCHDGPHSPESDLVGCPIQTCPEKVRAANPVTYVTASAPPLLILHGGSDPLVPHHQGEQFYMALNKVCATATRRSTTSQNCAISNPTPYQPSWQTLLDFLQLHLATKPLLP